MSRTVFDILEEIESTSGSNAKKDILQASRNNELLRDVFVAAQDPYTVYYVNKFKLPKATVNATNDDVLEHYLRQVLPQLSSRQVTGNDAKTLVEREFTKMNTLEQKWCQRILIHNLRCGVQESTVNKVWPNLIKSFSVALAGTLKSEFTRGEGIKILERVNYPVRVEPKLDGLRFIASKRNGEVTFYSRNGTILETMPTIRAVLQNANYDNVVLDAEVMGEDWNESVSVVMSSKSKKDDSNMFVNVFDAMPVDEWIAQKSELTYRERCKLVTKIVDVVNKPCVRQVAHIMAHNESDLKEFFAQCMNQGYEGVMLKTLHTTYEWDRSRNILKLKPCVTYEGVIVDWYEGRKGTKREGFFGGFVVVLPNGVITRVGSGFNDADRAKIQLDGADNWIGKVVECEAQPDPLTKDGLTVDGCMRFPVYVRVREHSDVDPKVIAAGVEYLSST